MRRRIVTVALAALAVSAACPGVGAAATGVSRALVTDIRTFPGRGDALERFYDRYVAPDGVFYGDLRAHGRPALDSLITALAGTDTTHWSLARRMALHVDLYNLVMMRAVVDRWKPGWTPAADGFAVFKAPLVPTRAGRISLDELEKKRTLAVFREPLLHVAFNCAARSCPPLRPRPWSRAIGDSPPWSTYLLDEFLRDTTRNQVDHARRVLRLSRILDWYAADFGGRAGVLRMMSQALGRDVSGYRVEFLDYDWSLNAATYPDGSLPR